MTPSDALARKLGLKPGLRAFVYGPTPTYLFAADAATLDAHLPACRNALARDGMLWISWPKKAAGVPTDLDRETVRARGLTAGLVDVKVCAVDATWSALKFVYRLTDR